MRFKVSLAVRIEEIEVEAPNEQVAVIKATREVDEALEDIGRAPTIDDFNVEAIDDRHR